MRLLNATTFEFEEFLGPCPAYAILSHRWQDDEVSLQDMNGDRATGKSGYSKIDMCCREAIKHDLQFTWIDTCCIDKASSAELTEAINSMYRWYQDARVCFVYLSDVEESEVDAQDLDALNTSQFGHKLIAPSVVKFYNSEWKFLGSKQTLIDLIPAITGIHHKMLEGGADPESFSVAQRMSWVSKRTTTRTEDIAYSLLGIFGVNMPMLYGEGERAFTRLREEIMKHSNDHSLFARTIKKEGYRGLLAKSPASFQHSHDIIPSINKLSEVPYSVTNFGLSITLAFMPWAMDTYFVALDCERDDIYDSRIGIYLRLLPERNQSLDGMDLKTFELSNFPLIHLRQTTEVLSRNVWDDRERFLKLKVGDRGTAGRIWYESADKSRYMVIKLGFDDGFNPGDRLTGMCETVQLVAVSISKEVVGGQRMWVVDIQHVV
ncbi:heterokaryon incompatibility protein-domain-containing protein [Leptodontidium sp. MPI-SDFR-AT-0119]|nr:heterokaryon incompatibility protein-domain-containing protein [Leptodontidium sp. MPI-SDFR-AT-0119]